MALDKKQLGSALNTIAYGQTMMAAARDYLREAEEEAAAAAAAADTARDVDVEELLDDPELEALHRDRLAAMKQEVERRAALERAGHGSYTEVAEGDFLEVVTQTRAVVVHFYHRDFERCKILDKHLAILARKHMAPRFIKLHAPDAPFFTVKLGVKMLPAVVAFVGGVSVGRIVGFEPLGGRDDFPTATLEAQLRATGVLNVDTPGQRPGCAGCDDSSGDEEQEELRERRAAAARGGGLRRGGPARRGSDDESSDFD